MIITFIIRVIFATFLGYVLGLEREKIGKPAGSRTYALVTLGSTVFTFISTVYLTKIFPGANPAQIASNVVVGIGFLGAGIIIFHNDKVEGVTTAAALWTSAAIGMLVGIGMYIEALVTTVLVLLLLFSEALKGKSWFSKKENGQGTPKN